MPWFEVAGLLLLGVVVGVGAIAFRYFLGMPPKVAFVIAAFIIIAVVVIPEITRHFSR